MTETSDKPRISHSLMKMLVARRTINNLMETPVELGIINSLMKTLVARRKINYLIETPVERRKYSLVETPVEPDYWSSLRVHFRVRSHF